MGATEKRQKSRAKEDTKQLGRKGKPQTLGGNVNYCIYYRTQDGGSFKIKNRGPYDSVIPILVYTQKSLLQRRSSPEKMAGRW